MPKKKVVRKLVPAAQIPSAAEIIKSIAERKDRLSKVRTAIAKDKVKGLPKYRAALKRLKRAQRRLTKEISRCSPRHAAKVAAEAAPAAAAAPAEAPKAE